MRILLLVGFGVALGSYGVSTEENEGEEARPNILFIAVDDLNDWVGEMGRHPQARTPNIDRLAQEGILFNNAHCQAPICGPSRASVLTGLLPSTSGNYLHVMDEDIRKSNEAVAESVFLQDYLEEYGYRTIGVGKVFHLGDDAGVHDEYGGHKSFGPYAEERFNYDPAWFDRPEITSTDWGAYPDKDEGMPDYHVAAYAEEQLQREQEKPFFLAVGFNRPHVPWYVPQKWFDLFPIGEIETPPYLPNDLEDVPEISRRVNKVIPTPTTEWAIRAQEWKRIVQAYLACIAFVDHQVGRVLDALETSEYAENTLVVLWSDHGYHIGEKNRFAKMSLWERSTHVPLIIKGPGIPAGQRLGQPVNLLDMYPTILDFANIDAPEFLEGHSLVPLWENPQAEWPHYAITFHGRQNVSLFSERYHYIVYENGAEELYDLQKDPNEWENLAGKGKHEGILQEFRNRVPRDQALLSPYNTLEWNAYFSEKVEAAQSRE